jgi:hypothetical protein
MNGESGREPASRTGGVIGNERLTAGVAAVLLVLLAIEGVSIVFIHPLLVVHTFVGVLLIGPVGLKIASTTHRFLRYYLRAEPYRRKGPPAVVLRVCGPLVTLTSLTVLGSGVALILVRHGRGTLLQLHKASFLVWCAVMSVHVLGHIAKLPAQVTADWRKRPRRDRRVAGRTWRVVLVTVSLLTGLAAALASLRLSTLGQSAGVR